MAEAPPTTCGDNDKWLLLERRSSSDLPLVVRARDNAQVTEFSRQHSAIAVICEVRRDLVNENGMPMCMDELYRIEDDLVAEASRHAQQAFHTASVTGDGRRVIYFALATGFPAGDLTSATSPTCCVVSLTSDFDFDTYIEFVTPTLLDRQWDGDRQVIGVLQENGDDGDQLRAVDFWFYGSRPQLEALVSHLSSAGFRLNRWLDETGGVILSQDCAAHMQAFADITPFLIATAEELGVTYDGWETFVVAKQSPTLPLKPSVFGKIFGQRKH